MKKAFPFISFILILFLSSCNKEFETVPEYNNLENFYVYFTIENNMLVFSSPTEYQNLLDTLANKGYEYFITWDKGSKFKSLRSEYVEKALLDELPIEDELLAVILSPQSKLKIGEYIFELDTDLGQVKVLKNSNDLKSAETFVFSFEDEIIPHLFEGQVLKSTDACVYPDPVNQTFSWDCWSEQIECKAKYYKAGIYNSIYVQMKLTNCISAGIEMTITTDPYSSCVCNKCADSKSLSYGETKSSTCKIYENLYRKTKRVNECDLGVNYSAISASSNCNNSAYLEIKF